MDLINDLFFEMGSSTYGFSWIPAVTIVVDELAPAMRAFWLKR